MELINNNAEKKFERDDFNMLYDYLWRDKSMAESQLMPLSPLYGKNKAIRAAAQERIETINNIISYMHIIERSGLTFSDGKIYREENNEEVKRDHRESV